VAAAIFVLSPLEALSGLCGVGHGGVGEAHRLPRRCRLPEPPGLVRRLPERDHGLNLLVDQQRVQPTVSVGEKARVFSGLGLDAAIYAV
jgi:hypothetical protein